MLKKKTFLLAEVTASGQTFSNQVDVRDSQAKKIVGFALQSDLPAQLTNRGRIGLKSDNMEISPKDWPASSFILGGQNVAPDSRLYSKLGAIEIGSGYIDYDYKDQDGAVAFVAYKVELLIEYEY